MKKDRKDRRSFFNLVLIDMFGGREKMYMLEEELMKEEEIQSPFMTTVRTFMSNKTAMVGLIIFLLILLAAFIGPMFQPIDLSFAETSQQNVAPGFDLMKFPQELNGKIQDISVGPTFTIAAGTDGKVYTWGKTQINPAMDLKNVPQIDGKVVKVSAGFDHAMALTEDGKLYTWGSDRLKQVSIPSEIANLKNIVDIEAGYQLSLVVTSDGKTYHMGNVNNNDYNENHEYQGKIEKISASSAAVLGLTKDGEAVHLGSLQTNLKNIPEVKGKVIDISSTANTMACLDETGEVYVWGNVGRSGLKDIPTPEKGKIVGIDGGRAHYVAYTDEGEALAWGTNYYKQAEVPAKVKKYNFEKIYTDYYQNYGITNDGDIVTWGLKGYMWGSDELGRDIFNRVLNGGKMTITIGVISVIISTIIGVIVGGISGFFGGRVDQILQRISEMVGSLPSLPLIMILSAILGNRVTPEQRIKLVMVIFGVLGWTGLQRLVRSQVLSVREQEYVVAARAVGIKESHIVFKHIIPNVISVIIVSATLRFAGNMLSEATLSFLGFGVQPPQPTWGNMLNGANNSTVIQNFWWRWVFTSIVLSVCVISINLIGDGLRDAIDPRSQER